MRFWMSLFIIFMLSGCDNQSAKDAILQVEVFREMYNNNNFSDIYSSTALDLKKAMTEQQLVSFLSKQKEDLGKFKSATLLNSTVINNSEVTLSFQTNYNKDSFLELFVYKKESNGYKLFYYTIDTQRILKTDPLTHAILLPK